MKKRYNCPHVFFRELNEMDVLTMSGEGNAFNLSPDYLGGSWE